MTISKYLAILTIISLVAITGMVTQFTSASKVDASKIDWSHSVPFSMKKDTNGNWIDVTNKESASASKADSASVASSKNEVNCIALCLGISTAKSASAADSESRTNSPSQNLLLKPTPLYTPVPTVGTECIDNTGSPNDEGYAVGYIDGNRDSVGLNNHGFNSSISGHHTAEFKQGYHDGYSAGFSDGKVGVNKNPC